MSADPPISDTATGETAPPRAGDPATLRESAHAIDSRLVTIETVARPEGREEEMRGAGTDAGAAISIIIPAHDEAGVIGRCIRAVIDGARPDELEVVVVCNGCADDTAAIARSFGPPVRVVETEIASKPHALNLGDRNAVAFPRFYVDADVIAPLASLRAVAREMEQRGLLAASPRLQLDLDRCSWPVRRFFEVWQRLPYVQHDQIGCGVYAISAEGRRRFIEFPDVQAEDEFIGRTFARHERATVSEATFTLVPPATLSSLVKVRARHQRSLFQLAREFPQLQPRRGGEYRGSVRAMLRDPSNWVSLATYTTISAFTRGLGWLQFRLRRGPVVWERDETSRTAPELNPPGLALRSSPSHPE